MSEWKKKPVVIEAVQWKGDLKDLTPFPDSETRTTELREGELYIQTLEGEMHCSLNDFIIRGVNGEYYPCKPDIFEMTYDKAPKDWRERLQIEHDELGDKCDKLVNALANHDVPEDQRPMLSIQFNTMHAYLQILKLRLDS